MLERLTQTESLAVACAQSVGQVRALESEWLELEKIAHGATLFQSWHWCALGMRQMERRNTGSPGNAEMPYVISIRENNRLIALLPLKIIPKRGRRILTGLAEPFQEFTDMLLAPHANASAIFASLLPQLQNAPADYVHFGQVRTDSSLYKAIKDDVPPMGERDGAPFVNLQPFADFDAYHKTLKAKTRKNMRNRANRLSKDGPVTHELASTSSDLQDLVHRTFENRAEWLAARGLTSSSFGDDMFLQFLRDVARQRSGKGGFSVLGGTLRQGDTVLAQQWGPVYRGRYYAFMSGWNKGFVKASPGAMHLEHMLRACFDAGLDRAEFLLPRVPYKETWANGCVQVQDHILPLNMRGWLFAHVWFDRVRPLLKRAIYAMAPGLRRVVTGAAKLLGAR
ncbi:MAG: GNAT family N-acetyltransferase [Pseudomonadota bacterium]